MHPWAKLAGVVLPRCVTAPNPRNMPDTFGRVLPIRKPVRSRGHRPSCAGLWNLSFVVLRTLTSPRGRGFTPSLFVAIKSQAKNREDSRNVFVTFCTTFKRRCPPLNPCAGASFAGTRLLAAIAGVGPARRCSQNAPPSAGLAVCTLHVSSELVMQSARVRSNSFRLAPLSLTAARGGRPPR